MFSSITAPRMSPVSGGPLFYTYARGTARAARAAMLLQNSNPVCRRRHDPRRMTHEHTHRSGQFGSSGRLGGCTVSDLIHSHYVQYRTAAGVARRQTRQMFIEMAFNLPLGFHDEAEARPVACSCCEGAGGGGAAVPQ